MQRQSDDAVCVEMVVQAKNRFPKLNACSFDKGFHSHANQAALKGQLELVALPRKGKLSQQAQAVEQAPAFARARRAHRRSQKDRMTWARMDRLASEWLPPPHVLHPWPEDRTAVRYPR